MDGWITPGLWLTPSKTEACTSSLELHVQALDILADEAVMEEQEGEQEAAAAGSASSKRGGRRA
jgi:hypothetical protein